MDRVGGLRVEVCRHLCACLALALVGCAGPSSKTPSCPTSREILDGTGTSPWSPARYEPFLALGVIVGPLCEPPLGPLASDPRQRVFRLTEGGGITRTVQVTRLDASTEHPLLRKVTVRGGQAELHERVWEEKLTPVWPEDASKLFTCLRQAGFWEMSPTSVSPEMTDAPGTFMEVVEAGRYHAVELGAWEGKSEQAQVLACRTFRGLLGDVTF